MSVQQIHHIDSDPTNNEAANLQVVLRPKTVREVLLHAALLIEERGWCQGEAVDDNGRVCTVGAIRTVYEGPEQDDWAYPWPTTTEDAVEHVRGVVDRAPADWNDTPGRTAAEVVAALREAAAST